VNVRKTFQIARERGIISGQTEEVLVEIGSLIHYPDRTYEAILQQWKDTNPALDDLHALEAFIKEDRVDLKREDAIQVLEKITELSDSNKPFVANFDLNHTIYLEGLLDSDQSAECPNGIKVTYEDFVNYARLEWDDFPQVIDEVITNSLILAFAREKDIALSESERETYLETYRYFHELHTDVDLEDWAGRNGLSLDDLIQVIDDWGLIQKMKRKFLKPDNRAIIWQLQMDGRYGSLADLVGRIEQDVLSGVSTPGNSVDEGQLLNYFRDTQGLPLDADVYKHAEEMGFNSQTALMLVLIKSYLYYKSKIEGET
jgi:hypothetical protein